MKIIIVSINYSPELTGIGKYTTDLAEWFVEQGHGVWVVTAPPYYPAWKLQQGYHGFWYTKEKINGVQVLRCPLWVPNRPTGTKRILHLLSFAVSCLPILMIKAVVGKPNLVLTVEPPIFCAPAAWLAARISGGQSWLHVQDFEVDAAFSLGMLKSKFAAHVARTLEAFIKRRFDRVSTISTRMQERLALKNIPGNKQVFMPNWADTARIYPLDVPGAMRQSLDIQPETIVLLYSGNMGEKQGIEIVIEAARKLQSNSRLLFLLCGAGAALERLQQQAEGLDNVRFMPLQPLERFNELMNSADIHLLPQRPDAEDLVMPSKLTAMLASGRPVIATANSVSQVAEVVSSCGIVVDAHCDALVKAINVLAADPDRRIRLGAKGRQYAVTHWDRERILTRAFPDYISKTRDFETGATAWRADAARFESVAGNGTNK